jgi:hypothetical protein
MVENMGLLRWNRPRDGQRRYSPLADSGFHSAAPTGP